MPNDLTPFRFPWEPAPQAADPIELLKRDFAIAVKLTGIKVHSNDPVFLMVANTERGQLIPRNEVKFSNGTTVELQDIGMPQPGNPYMTVPEILEHIMRTAWELNITLVKS